MKKKILLADDSSTTRSYLKNILVENGYEIIEAENGVKALIQINRNVPDVMILDLLMPEMDGFEVLEKLREQNISFPIIVVTADIQDQVKEECLNLGASRFLNKPVTPEVLLETIKEILP